MQFASALRRRPLEVPEIQAPAQPSTDSESLPKYAAFRSAVLHACTTTQTMEDFSAAIGARATAKALRTAARAELQSIYASIRGEFDLPNIPVYLPTRKKISVRGMACALAGIPDQIRIYPIIGSWKSHEEWRPSDISCSTPAEVLETLIHESAHILEASRHGVMGHEENFVEAYNEIDDFLKTSTYASLRDPCLRLTGCPRDSAATRTMNAERAARRMAKYDSPGCGLVGVLGMLGLIATITWIVLGYVFF